MSTIRWGILGPGAIARAFATGLREARGAELTAVGSRDLARAEAFAAEFGADSGATRAHGSYGDLAADPDVDAVYVASPHAFHADHALLALDAGKHVLCEKPLAANAVQAERMIAAARDAGLALMEGLWTRFLPTLVRARELVAAGTIGEVRSVAADFGFRAPYDPASRLFAPELAGGALLDIGVYPLNLAFLFCGPPVAVLSTANLGATGVDEEAAIVLRHDRDRISNLTISFRADTPLEAHVIGTDGRLVLRRPWWAGERLDVMTRDGRVEELDCLSRGGGFAHEAEAFMDMIRTGSLDSDVMPLAESLEILRTMDGLRERWGLRYPFE